MLNVSTKARSRYCDGVSRRSMLKLGACTLGGLTLAQLYQAEAAAGVGSSNKAIINIHLSGGPCHQDMFDLKPEAPREFRGEFNPIKTNVPGIEICEHLPQLGPDGRQVRGHPLADRHVRRSQQFSHADGLRPRSTCGTSAAGPASAAS